jgi:CheY-like chemotaxis protein
MIQSLLLVENEAKDIQFATKIAHAAGIPSVEVKSTLRGAMERLEKALSGGDPLPEAIVLDLDLGYDSGYELMRFWHNTPRLSQVPLIVWSILGDEQREMCNLFKVNRYVGKWEGAAAFQEALEKLETPGT